ncbi:hypothetical protein [Tessaracoccus oleiagri]|uniref:Uncharacterized protein n=1 Tax=Tessaracoccus oleiagri TaxID=686624 RepID=A0A1G9JHN8_9ACTN|nr:hypothetical protein [Tessaracoccus oleiagri]SDL36654.1 hypothetical protein SAMN04488242_1239 [Tessaracoccus oleiagri]
MSDTADERLDDRDGRILAGIAELYDEIDPPPARLADDVVFSLSLAALNAELASIERDAGVAVRAHAGTQTVTFSSSALQLMVTGSDENEGTMRIDAWVTGGGVTVELLEGTNSTPAVSDAHGRLVWRGVARGPIRFLIHPPGPDARPVLTPMIEL